jgi:hypothetical protein
VGTIIPSFQLPHIEILMNKTRNLCLTVCNVPSLATDSSSFTPPTPQDGLFNRVVSLGAQFVVHVPKGQGDALRCHLASYGIRASVADPEETAERVDIEAHLLPEDVQTIVDKWVD